MSTTSPILQQRDARPYLCLALSASMAELPGILPDAFARLRAWARAHQAPVDGAPFVRYRRLARVAAAEASPARTMDVDVGLPLAHAITVDPGTLEGLSTGVLPPGLYATLLHTGPYEGLAAATATLVAWGEANGVDWHRSAESRAERWEAWLESYLTDPQAQPDSARWQTEIAFLSKQ